MVCNTGRFRRTSLSTQGIHIPFLELLSCERKIRHYEPEQEEENVHNLPVFIDEARYRRQHINETGAVTSEGKNRRKSLF